ncbi:MAG: endonuclease MutS2 [Lachnospiraceae bacterium]|nr:endonuclease MutS2 [Lachnospiraceae bacterium]
MNSKVLKTLEYDKIILMLEDCAYSPLGKDKCRQLLPSDDYAKIKSMQTETSDALKRIWQKGSISFYGVKDITSSLKRLEIGGALGTAELLAISSLLKLTLKIKTFSRRDSEEGPDSLDEMFAALEPLSNLNYDIEKCIVSEEEIADDASANLKSIRRQMKITNDRIRSQLSSLVNSQAGRTYLQDAIITMRDGRYCVPVKQEHRGSVPGIIHDQSSTGSTLFVEPMAIVQLNNQLRELEVKEQDEIQVILFNLSMECAEHIIELKTDMDTLAELDFIFARASLSKNLKCSEPVFNNRRYINIKQGRHPLLDPKKVVPINIWLGDGFDLLVVTGPNTGGKTVSLKTVGLFTLMGQAGLHIPAFEGSSLGVFSEVFADIGDEQSIEQNLSTFSSHMVNIVSILNQADDRSLVLFDELCSGTDPVEGAALAISILNDLRGRKTRTMATTHYSEIKLFALSTDGVENACCEFDVATLQPTYKLLIGIPGKSNAFAISSKLGLPDYIIEDAKTHLDSENESFEDVLAELERNRVTIEKDREEIAAYKSQVKSLKRDYELKSQRLDERRDKIINDAKEEARKLLQEAKDTADQAIRDINKLGKSGSNKEMEKVRTNLGSKLKSNQTSTKLKDKPSIKTNKPADFKPGTAVKVLSMNLKGTVSTTPDANGNLMVQMGILKSRVNISDLLIIDEPDVVAPGYTRSNSGKIKMSKSSSVKTEINLLGKTVDEAIAELDKYLDDAYLAHLPSVSVVHGKGTGALRKGIHEYLKKCSYVKEFRLGAYGEGEAGVTIVTFK